ncbi:MAG: tripartite tricarboxylate transporter substrate binding protein [Pseudomonadota bacterium]
MNRRRCCIPSVVPLPVLVLVALGLALGGAVVPQAWAQPADKWPARAIRILIGYAPGTSIDINGRFLAQRLSEEYGQPVVVDNRPGATGAIAAEAVAKAAPDGYTLLAGPGSGIVATPWLQKVQFDPLRDFAPVALIGEFSFLMVAHPSLPVKTARDVLALARKRPGEIAYGSNGVGSAFHLAGVLFGAMGNVDILHVPYRGGGNAALVDLTGGRIHLMWNSPVFLLPHVKSGRMRAIAVTGPKRVPAMPDVLTIAESGLPGYSMTGWQGVVAPANTPREVVTRLNGSIGKVLGSTEGRDAWTGQGMEPTVLSPEQFGAMMRADFEAYGKLIKRIAKEI